MDGMIDLFKIYRQAQEKEYTLKDLLSDGKAVKAGFTEADADSKELAMGIEVELEHTSNRDVAKKIALDHLAEFPRDYYTRLKKMESEAKSKEAKACKQQSYDLDVYNLLKNNKIGLAKTGSSRYDVSIGGHKHGQVQTNTPEQSQEEQALQKVEEPVKTIQYPAVADIRAIADDPEVNLGDPTGYILGGEEKIEAAIARMQSNYFGTELYPTLFDKAAVLLESIAMTHPFENCNKRVATEAALAFLGENGLFMDEDFNEDEVIDVVLKLVTHQMTQEQLRDWLITQFSETEN